MAITTRSGKGSPLTHNEMDANLSAITEKTSATGSVKGSSGTTAQRPASPVEGYTRFNTTLNRHETYNGSTWITAVSSANTDTSDMSFVVDEDAMTSDSATKVPTQQSVKAYVDSQVQSKDALSELSGTLDDVADGTTYVKSTNDFTDAEVTKLSGIETAATADQTNAEIKTAYEANADTNEFSDAEQTKLSGIEASADVTDTTNVASAGALMDSEVTNLSEVKAFDSSDYATAAQGTTADAALPKAGGTMTGDVSLGTNVKAKFGAGDDLQIYHDGIGGNSYIQDVGTGNLYIDAANNLQLRSATDSALFASFAVGGNSQLYHAGSSKLATTTTGIDVTGKVNGLEINTTATSNLGLGTGAVDSITTGDYNVGVGDGALTAITSGASNTGIGYQALYSNITGAGNVAVGDNTLKTNTTGAYNTATGAYALNTNTTGGKNIAVGKGASQLNTTGSENTALGYQALRSNTIGVNNTAVGKEALFNNTASYNTAVGRAALRGNTTGASNTAIGYNAGDNITTGSSNIIIGSSVDAPSASASNQLNIGGWITGAAGAITVPGSLTTAGFTSTGIDDNATSTAITIDASEYVGIGATIPAHKLDVSESRASAYVAKITNTDTANGYGIYVKAGGSNSSKLCARFDDAAATTLMTIASDTTKNVTVSQGNLVIGTSGKGIDFSATSDGSGTMTSEVLDDYEEGTWIPTITFETPGDLSVAYHANTNATYTKVGRLVTISFYVRTTTFSHSTASGDLRILGIPFTPRTYTGMKSEGGTTYYGLNKSGFTQATVLVNSASSVITMSAVGIAGSSISTVNANDAPGVGGRVDISGVISYETDS